MREWVIFLSALLGTFLIDQATKELFLNGFEYKSRCISLELHLNRGVAFSMFSFLGNYLKWIQLFLIMLLVIFVIKEGWIKKYPLFLALLMGGALGNLYDRFIHNSVVDFVYWHCGFNFAVFNFADVAIDIGIGAIIIFELLKNRKKSEVEKD
ncbi:MAG: lipoprotein signal peptidase [Epsilonproteobacteria bacterium]|nr:lipoprotein signal peptidase [Campylobacterota bacterium]